jgi:hypothetical protein
MPSRAAAGPIPARAASSATANAVTALGRLPFLGGRLLAALVDEAGRQRPDGQPGDVLSRLAVSRQLREAVSAALGEPVVPTYDAVYQYHGPGHEVRPHRDKAGYPFVFHLTLEHEGVASGSAGSVLDVGGERTALPVGEGLVLRGRDVLHGWTVLGPNEHRTLIAVGFEPEHKGEANA